MNQAKKLWNPYAAGAALGLVMLFSFLAAGKGLGASGAANRIGVAMVNTVAPSHAAQTPYMADIVRGEHSPLDDWFVFEILGVVLGGIVGAHTAGRLKGRIIKGPRISSTQRLIFALSGGILMGMAARLGRGCTSGQALSGGALLSAGSFIFMFAIFAGAYALAYFVRKEWT
jgi:uncharacterized protein